MPNAILRDRACSESEDDHGANYHSDGPMANGKSLYANSNQITEANRGQIEVPVLNNIFEMKDPEIQNGQERHNDQSDCHRHARIQPCSANPKDESQTKQEPNRQQKSSVKRAGDNSWT